MKPTDFFLEFKDLLGRIVPGVIILTTMHYILLHFKVENFDLLNIYKNNTSPFIMFMFILTYFVGDLNINIAFKLRRFLYFKNDKVKKPSVKEFLQKRDHSEKVNAFFQKEFDDHVLDRCFWDLQFFCKESTVDKLPLVHGRAKNKEARVNYKLGMIVPIIMLSISFFLYEYYILGVFLIFMAPFFYYEAIQDTKSEVYLTFINYYQSKV